jgi:hypothetical protein
MPCIWEQFQAHLDAPPDWHLRQGPLEEQVSPLIETQVAEVQRHHA